jgi:predicted anti-sigma-YlaC factor YlaD
VIGPDDIKCDEIVELVTAYLEGGLDETTRTRFELHVVTCADCANYLDQMRRATQLTGEVVVEEPSPEQLSALQEAFRGWRRRTAEEER